MEVHLQLLCSTLSAHESFCFLSRITSIGVAPTASASASVSFFISSSLLSVKRKNVVTRDYKHFMVILRFCLVVVTSRSCHHTRTAPRSEWIKINMRLNFLCRRLSRLFWLSHLQTEAAHQRYHHPPCPRGPWAQDCFQYHVENLRSYRLIPSRLKGSHPMILTNPSVSVTAA